MVHWNRRPALSRARGDLFDGPFDAVRFALPATDCANLPQPYPVACSRVEINTRSSATQAARSPNTLSSVSNMASVSPTGKRPPMRTAPTSGSANSISAIV